MRIRLISIALLGLAGCASAPVAPVLSAPDDSVQVMVLGTWHFAGSDSDLVSAKADSVLTPHRQSELDEAARRLAAFKPTVVVTERVTEAPDYVDPKFAGFTPADLSTTENERVQIGYRLAAKAGVSRVYGLDEQPSEGEPDYFPFDKVMANAAATGKQGAVEALIGSAQKMAVEQTERFKSLTMSEALIEANRGELASASFYYELLKLDAGESQPGAELNAYWYMRNAKIFSKLIDVTKPGDRVIIVYGAGHKFWLEHLADQTPGFVRVDPVDYLAAGR
jgi:hypothetical protein